MPVREPNSVPSQNKYLHIYNHGANSSSVFKDEQDYETFINFLKDYLTPEHERELTQKTFTIKNRTFTGTPHLPKNYHGTTELVAFTLVPDHFHLILKESTPKAAQAFLRSLFTRYSIYFNKKYTRSGSLFDGPYKSATVESQNDLLLLIKSIHNCGSWGTSKYYSSHHNYTKDINLSWIKSQMAHNIFENVKHSSPFNKAKNVKEFLDETKLTEIDLQSLTDVFVERPSLLERSDFASKPRIEQVPTISTKEPAHRHRPSILSLSTVMGVFVVLLAISITNVQKVSSKSEVLSATTKTDSEIAQPTSTPHPTTVPEITEDTKPIVFVKINSKTGGANIRQSDSLSAPIIRTAKTDEIFILVSETDEWFEINLDDKKTGFLTKSLGLIEQTQ